MSKMGGECILGLETPSWDRRGVGTWGTVRWRPAAALTRASRLANLPAVSQQPGVARLLNARVRPSSVSSARVGSRVPGAPPPRSRHRDPPQGRRWFGRRPNPERPGRLPQPHPAALTRPRRRPGACPCPLEKLAGSNPEPATPLPAYTIARPTAGGIARRPPLHTLRPRAAPAPGQSPGSRGLQNPRGPEETGRQRGWGGAGRGSVARASPQGPASGRCRQPRLPVAGAVGCAGVSSLWPAAGWWREEGTAEGSGRGLSARGHGRTRKPGARDSGNCCGVALAFLYGEADLRGAQRGAPPRGLSRARGRSLGGKTQPFHSLGGKKHPFRSPGGKDGCPRLLGGGPLGGGGVSGRGRGLSPGDREED